MAYQNLNDTSEPYLDISHTMSFHSICIGDADSVTANHLICHKHAQMAFESFLELSE